MYHSFGVMLCICQWNRHKYQSWSPFCWRWWHDRQCPCLFLRSFVSKPPQHTTHTHTHTKSSSVTQFQKEQTAQDDDDDVLLHTHARHTLDRWQQRCTQRFFSNNNSSFEFCHSRSIIQIMTVLMFLSFQIIPSIHSKYIHAARLHNPHAQIITVRVGIIVRFNSRSSFKLQFQDF